MRLLLPDLLHLLMERREWMKQWLVLNERASAPIGELLLEKEGNIGMKRVSSSESFVPDSSVLTTRSAIGAQSRPLRFLIVGLTVVVWWGLGFLLHLALPAFLLLGVPLLVVFQVGVE